MHFTKSVLSAAAFLMPLAVLAAPSASPETPLDDIVNGQLSRRELAIRQGNTCAFGGDKLCTSRCFIGGNGGGYCNEENVCVCNG